ncbi:hypothetical protein KUTeg_007666 [Tegillarca granosa]|uniref:Enoyl reductase (ER) domain-containing protein n=1 Tax=Tegillarca granosa TaxID=220873 RepID=A0ABQ9FDY7_TEGGR|nr:hypothetical protein KUTeg_007666 [Tegillarca granosa]
MMRAVKFDKPGGADNLYIGQVPVPELRQKEVLIEVYSSAINRADTLQRQGRYPPPKGESDILGLEATGKISQKGPGCSDKWKIGDRVMALLAGGGNAEYVACHEDILMSVPSTMKFTEAAAIPEVWLTSYQLLHTIGQVKKGDTVLIHAGGSGIGTTATQLAVLAGATPIVTAGSAGVNLILDCIGESFYEQNINSIANEGRWVLYGLLGGGNVNGDIFSKMLRKRITVTGTTLRARSIELSPELHYELDL